MNSAKLYSHHINFENICIVIHHSEAMTQKLNRGLFAQSRSRLNLWVIVVTNLSNTGSPIFLEELTDFNQDDSNHASLHNSNWMNLEWNKFRKIEIQAYTNYLFLQMIAYSHNNVIWTNGKKYTPAMKYSMLNCCRLWTAQHICSCIHISDNFLLPCHSGTHCNPSSIYS